MYEDFGFEPYLQGSIEPGIFFEQALIVGLVASIIAIYPLIKLLSLNAINEMRS